jgi:hypothetical protein
VSQEALSFVDRSAIFVVGTVVLLFVVVAFEGRGPAQAPARRRMGARQRTAAARRPTGAAVRPPSFDIHGSDNNLGNWYQDWDDAGSSHHQQDHSHGHHHCHDSSGGNDCGGGSDGGGDCGGGVD